MTKMELATGMFGVDTNEEIFVVAGNKLIFEGGQYNDIDDLDENLMFTAEDGIAALYEAHCFQQVEDGRGKLIWKRPEPGKEVKEAPKTEEGAITITEEEFAEVIKTANEMFMEIAKKTPGREEIDLLMGLQNIAFGALVSNILFNKEID